jgi:hypothetical protein
VNKDSSGNHLTIPHLDVVCAIHSRFTDTTIRAEVTTALSPSHPHLLLHSPRPCLPIDCAKESNPPTNGREISASVLNSKSQDCIGKSKDKSSRLLTEHNLRALQEQLQSPTVFITRDEVLSTTDTQYQRALRERGWFLLTLNDARAIKLSNVVQTATSDTMVASVITSSILDFVAMRQLGQDTWMNLAGQWSNPDAAIVYNENTMGGYFKAQQYLGGYCSPIKADPALLFPVVTVQAKDYHARYRNAYTAAVILRNLRKLRSCADMGEGDLKAWFDHIAHVITINFTKSNIAICCAWSAVADDGNLEVFSKPIALMSSQEGIDDFHKMTQKICNAVHWATKGNKQWIRDDLEKLLLLVPSLPPVEPEQSVAGSGLDS